MNPDNEKRYESLLRGPFLKTLNKYQLDDLLDAVLNELRSRDSDELKQDVLTRSQSLRVRKISDSD
jgi:hypothetical protein